MSSPKADISENQLLEDYPRVMEELLRDKSGDGNIIWACSDYEALGTLYEPDCEMLVQLVTGEAGDVIMPRTYKQQENQSGRTKEKAEVFTPGWVVNFQNNLVDEQWFGSADVFTKVGEDPRDFSRSSGPIAFPDTAETDADADDQSKKTWQSYVRETFLEAACGEAPYVVSRYDAATGESIDIPDRYGRLDRKLRVISENLPDAGAEDDGGELWLSWVKEAYKSVYGYEWQGDSLLIARENLLFTFFDVYRDRYSEEPDPFLLLEIAKIISWNFFQMDGLKYVRPNSCHDSAPLFEESLFFDDEVPEGEFCIGCRKNLKRQHNGTYARTMDWKRNKPVRVVDMSL